MKLNLRRGLLYEPTAPDVIVDIELPDGSTIRGGKCDLRTAHHLINNYETTGMTHADLIDWDEEEANTLKARGFGSAMYARV